MLISFFFFIASWHSMTMVFLLVFLTLLYSFWFFKILGSFWYSFVVIMVIISGILVLFTYMVSVTYKESFEANFIVLFLLFLAVSLLDMFLNKVSLGEMGSLKMWDQSLVMMSEGILLFLLMVMLMVVWLSDLSEGALKF